MESMQQGGESIVNPLGVVELLRGEIENAKITADSDVKIGLSRPGQITAQVSAELLKLSINLTDLSRVVSQLSAEELRVSEKEVDEVSLQMIDGQLEQLEKDVKKCREADEPVQLVELEKDKVVEVVAALAEQLEDIAKEWMGKSGQYGGFKRFESWNPSWRTSGRRWQQYSSEE
jgi:hypothetical protein